MNANRARELVRAFVDRRVLLIGDLMMDEWAFGTVSRISPEAPIPVVRMPLTAEARTERPGGAGNVAAILLRLGARVKVVGVVGDDGLGERLVQHLEGAGAEVSGVLTDPSRPTTHKLRIIAGRQQLLRIDTEQSDTISPSLSGRVRDHIRSGLDGADVVLVADYAKGLLCGVSLPQELIARARARDVPFCADPKPVNMGLFRGAFLVSPNESEALAASGVNNGPAEVSIAEGGAASATADCSCHATDPRACGAGPPRPAAPAPLLPPAVLRAGRLLCEQLEADLVFVTRGERGIAVFCRDGQVHNVPAAVEAGVVGDGTGCGDAASAASALALSAGADSLEAAALANAAGGVVSRFVGVHSPTADEIVEWVERSR